MKEAPETNRADGRRITGPELRTLLVKPCRKFRIEVPPEADCAAMAKFIAPGPIRNEMYRSLAAHRHLIALRNSMPEAIAWWEEAAKAYAGSARLTETAQTALEKLRSLHASLRTCDGLVSEIERAANFDWEPAADSAALALTMLVRQHAPYARFGLSKGGPCATFVMTVLDQLGWLDGPGRPTEDAVVQRLKVRAHQRKPQQMPESVT